MALRSRMRGLLGGLKNLSVMHGKVRIGAQGMNTKNAIARWTVLALLWVQQAMAAPFSADTHEVYPGDFNGDGKSDLLVIAKDPAALSGIYAADASGQPTTVLQSWSSGFLGISWHENRYTAVVGNFDGVNGDDVLLQRNGTGTSFLLPTNSQGELFGISQYINGWGADSYRIIAGKFDGNPRADVFLQARQPSGSSSVILSDGSGHLTVTNQAWANNHLGFKWSVASAIVHAGDFNGDGRDDLLVQAKPEIALVDFDIPIPVPVFKPNTFGITLATLAGQFTSIHDVFSRKELGLDFAPSEVDLVIADFNGDGREDTLLLARKVGQSSFVVLTDGNGQLTQASTVSLGAGTLGAELRTLAADFNGDGRAEVYRLSASSAGSNSIVSFNGSGGIAANLQHTPAPLASTAATTSIGQLPGGLAVDESGASRFEIPLDFPEGTAGLTPSMGLVYSSSAGDSLLGVGWSIQGLSAMTRCPRTWVQDGAPRDVRNDLTDRFCLDGNQLRLASGTYGVAGASYRTELESFSRIISYGSAGNGPAHFVVERRDGLIYEYGASADSRIESLGQATVRVWALNRIRDRSGNAIDFTYEEDAANGSYQIKSVLYTRHLGLGVAPAYVVNFIYQSKPSDEVDAGYMAGSVIRQVKRLARVEVRYNTETLLRRYDLAYESALSSTRRSRLRSVQVCAGAALECLPSTTFTYQDGTPGLDGAVNTGIAVHAPLPLDVNGDGREDLVYSSSATVGSGSWRVLLAQEGGYQVPIDTGVANTAYTSAFAIDYNADGRGDLLVPYAGNTWWVMLGGATGLAAPVNTGAPVTTTGRGLNARALDVNGDGLEDLVWADLVGYGGGDAVRYRLRELVGAFSSTVSTLVGPFPPDQIINEGVFAPGGQPGPRRVPDFNGDGRGDLFLKTTLRVLNDANGQYRFFPNLSVRVTGGDAFGTAAASASTPYFGDFNGDGKSDLVYYNSSGAIVLQFSTGTGFGAALATGSIVPYGPAWIVLDWDNDGFDDLLLRETASGTLHLLRSSGEALLPAVATGLGIGTPQFVADISGDGLLDLGAIEGGAYTFRLHLGNFPDLLQTATDGYGQLTRVQYAPLPRANYVKENTASFPEQDFQGSMYVVNSTTQTNGVGGTYNKAYTYYGARQHLQGRGFEGFRARRSIDSRDGLQVYEYFNQAFPYTATLSQLEVMQPNGSTRIARVQNSFGSYTYGSGFESRTLPYASASTQSSYEAGGTYNGVLLSTVTTSNQYDSSTGTLYDSTRTVVEAASANGLYPGQSYTQRTLLPQENLITDVASWCLGRPGRVQQINSHSGYGGDSQTRNVDATWDASFCRPTQSVIEPNHPTLKVTQTLGYDEFGNLNRSTVTPVSQSARVSRIDWGSDGRFPRMLTNPLSQVISLNWWGDRALLRDVTDPNGRVASSSYDAFDRLTLQTQPDGTSTRIRYLGCDSECVGIAHAKYKVVSTQLDAANLTVSQRFTVFDSYDRPRRASSYSLEGNLITQLTEYGADARVQRVSIPFMLPAAAVWTNFTYDLVGREVRAVLDRSSDLDGSAAVSGLEYQGLTVRSTDPQGRVRVDTVSAVGQLVKAIQALGTPEQAQTSYDYDAFNSLVRTTDAAGNQIVVGYNVRGFKTSSSDPDMGNWTYDYYALGELKRQTDAREQTTTFTYDSLSRPLTRTELADAGASTQTTTWIWGASAASYNIGQLQSVSLGGYSESYSYDTRSRLASVAVTTEGTTYTVGRTYNAAGLLDTLTYPQSTGTMPLKVKYEYDTVYRSGLLRRISDFNSGASFWQASTTTALDQYSDVLLGNNLRTLTQFDSITGVINRLDTTLNGSSRQSLQYRWDKVGNLTSRQDLALGKTETFSYDALYRMTQAAVSGATPLAVSYNAIGNITSKSDVGGYSYHPTKKHAVLSAGANSYSYDANGNANTRNGASLTWTAYNLPKLINQSDGNSSQFQYGPDRQRYKHVAVSGANTETTIYIQGIFEKLTRGSLIEYKHSISGPGGVIALHTRRSDATSETIYPLGDHLGSTETITNGSGATLAKLSYTPFGARRNAVTWSGVPSAAERSAIADTSRRGFTDHEHLDNLNLVHMNGRVYDPVVGRFISADPFVAEPFDSQGFNRYSYVGNNPLSFTDPSGFSRQLYRHCQVTCSISSISGGFGRGGTGGSAADGAGGNDAADFANRLQLQQILERQRAALRGVRTPIPIGPSEPTRGEPTTVPNLPAAPTRTVLSGAPLDTRSTVGGFTPDGTVSEFRPLFRDNFAGRVLESFDNLAGLALSPAIPGPTRGLFSNQVLTARELQDSKFGLLTAAVGPLTRIGGAAAASVSVFRVQGGVLPNASKIRFLLDEAGNFSIQGSDVLFVNVGQRTRALEFLARRGDQAFLVELQVNSSFIERLRSIAVGQNVGRQFPGRPQVVDATRAADQFGIPAGMFDELLRNVVPGSVRIGRP
jgi:RHS repeat-associated protein